MNLYDFSKIKNIRSELLIIDKFLKVGDEFKVLKNNDLSTTHGNRSRSNMQIKNAIFNTLRNIELINEDDKFFHFSKNKVYRNYNNSLTLGIITNGEKDDVISKQIRIAAKYVEEIIICGDTSVKNNKLKIISYNKKNSDIRIPISTKKELIIQDSNSEFILLIHDHVYLDDDFFQSFFKQEKLYDVYSCNRYSIDDYPKKISSHGDVFDFYGSMDAYSFVKKNRENITKRINENTCVNGAFICVRKCCIDDIKWPSHLQWGDMEDIYISKALHLNGCILYFDKLNRFFASSQRTGKSKFVSDSLIFKVINYIKSFNIKILNLFRNEYF